MTFVASLIGTVLLSIYALVALVSFTSTMEALRASYYVEVWEIINSIWSFVVVIPALIFNALAITAFRCSHEQYQKKRPILITAAVFDFVWALGLTIGFIAISITAFEMLMFLAFVAVGVLIIIDFSQEEKRLQKLANTAQPTQMTEPATTWTAPTEAAPQQEHSENK